MDSVGFPVARHAEPGAQKGVFTVAIYGGCKGGLNTIIERTSRRRYIAISMVPL